MSNVEPFQLIVLFGLTSTTIHSDLSVIVSLQRGLSDMDERAMYWCVTHNGRRVKDLKADVFAMMPGPSHEFGMLIG